MTATGPKPNTYRLVAIGAVVVIVGFLVPRIVPAGPSASAAAVPAPDYTSFILKMGVGTAAFAVACFAVFRKNQSRPSVAGNLEILATVPIGTRGLVHLVRAGNRRLVLGVDLHGVKALAELPGPPPSTVIGPLRVVPETA